MIGKRIVFVTLFGNKKAYFFRNGNFENCNFSVFRGIFGGLLEIQKKVNLVFDLSIFRAKKRKKRISCKKNADNKKF